MCIRDSSLSLSLSLSLPLMMYPFLGSVPRWVSPLLSEGFYTTFRQILLSHLQADVISPWRAWLAGIIILLIWSYNLYYCGCWKALSYWFAAEHLSIRQSMLLMYASWLGEVSGGSSLPIFFQSQWPLLETFNVSLLHINNVCNLAMSIALVSPSIRVQWR